MRQRKYYIQVQPWAVYVKEGHFFEAQGGLRENWGKAWEPVMAVSIEDARYIGELQRTKG